MLDQLQKLGKGLTAYFSESNLEKIAFSSAQKKRKVKDVFSGHPIASILPYEAYDEEYGIFIGKNSIGFTIETIPLAGSEESHQREMNSIFEEVLEEGASIQCLLWADHRVGPILDAWKDARNQAEEIYQKIAEKRSQFFKESKKISPRLFRFIFSYTIPFQGGIPDLTLLRNLKKQQDKILTTLNSMTYAYSWTAKHLLELIGGLLNFTLDPDLTKRKWNPLQSLASQLPTGGSLIIKEDGLEWQVDEKNEAIHFKSFRVIEYPDQWSLGSMQHLIGDVVRDNYQITEPFYLHYGVHCPQQSQVGKGFNMRSQMVEKQGSSHALLRMIPELNEELKECVQARQANSKGARFVWTQLSVGIWGVQGNISQTEQTLRSLFRLNRFTITENHYLHLPQFLSALPLTWSEYVQDLKNLNVLKTTLTSECGNLVPIQGEWQGTLSSPGMLLLGRRGQLMNWSPFGAHTGNHNVIVAGRSGSGKSVFMQDLILNGLGIGAKTFILEVGRSFEKLCHILNGQAIEFSRHSNICLNPFSLISSEDTDELNDSFVFIKSIIGCMAAPIEGTTDYQNSLIERAVSAVWKDKNNKATITDVAYWLSKRKDQQAKNLAVMLTPYTKDGIYARYFEGENNVSFTNPMVWIELEELKERKDLQSVVVQLFIMTITNQVFLGDRKTPFFICIDEAWDLLRGKRTGEFINTLARRLRKYQGSLVIGTQGIDDFFTNSGTQAAYQNCDWTCLLAQKQESISYVSNHNVDFGEDRIMALKSISIPPNGFYREIMICDADGGYSIARLILDPFSRLLYSTTPEEYAALKELRGQGMTISEAINYLLRKNEKKGSKIS